LHKQRASGAENAQTIHYFVGVFSSAEYPAALVTEQSALAHCAVFHGTLVANDWEK
jgi:hypothetical protein